MQLSVEDRGFLGLVAAAAFSNPFGDERARLDLQISGLPAGSSHEKCLDVALVKVRELIAKLDKEGNENLGAFEGSDRERVMVAHLFDVFHRFVDDFDELIRRQLRTDEGLCPVPFWREVVGEIVRRGISEEDALRYFAMFYQLRRAFYFIQCALAGRSPSMKQLRRGLWNNVFTHDVRLYDRYLWNRMEDFSTLLLGETGTGKGAAAAAIGRSGFIPFDSRKQCFSESFTRSYTALNLSQFPESLMESELFGHRKGAFTGAVEAHEGVFARCSPHGAIFLDEIGDVSIPVQIKLLQVLQERVFSPVGSHEKRRFHGRVIAATNRPLDRLRREGQFRDDFFYRLCSDVIVVPTLRQRMAEDAGELDELLSLLVRRIVGEDAADVAMGIRDVIVRDVGVDYPWPGNVRELEQAVRRVLLARSYAGDVRRGPADPAVRLADGVLAGTCTAQNLLAGYCALLYRRHGTYEDVARCTGLDRRTAKKYVQEGQRAESVHAG